MKFIQLAFICLIVISYADAYGQEAKKIAQRALEASYHQGKTLKAQVSMIIYDKKGRQRQREMTMLRTNDSDGPRVQKYYVYFSKPSDVKKMVFMVWKNRDRGDDRWLYLPAMDLVKRIAIGDERTSFIGSHFVYEDVSGRNVDGDTHEVLKESDEYFILRSTPKASIEVEFSYYKSWIDKETFIPMKVEYFNDQGILYRKYSVHRVAEVGGFPTVMESEIEDSLHGGKTQLTLTDVTYNLTLPASIFTERFLRRPPLKFLM